MTIEYQPIGIIRTPYKSISGMPVQAALAKGATGTVELNEEYTAGLLHLDGFSHLIMIYHLHLSKGFDLQVMPFLDTRVHGVFATRAPKRPNPVGISVVKIDGISGNKIRFENADMLDGTPLLDLKPYIPEFDIHQVEKAGWMEDKSENPEETLSDNRFG